MSSPSLYKSGYIAFQPEDKKVIDSNALFERRFKELKESQKEAPKPAVSQPVFREEANDLDAVHVARLLGEEPGQESDGFFPG